MYDRISKQLEAKLEESPKAKTILNSRRQHTLTYAHRLTPRRVGKEKDARAYPRVNQTYLACTAVVLLKRSLK